ncbi:MAG: carboxypeptidase regulatory-like domain-containing protein [Longimicrobiales bacterium]|nr:carboxypeptidase regulatory-like domain-containing protein [Longimicrobiales bacterium]
MQRRWLLRPGLLVLSAAMLGVPGGSASAQAGSVEGTVALEPPPPPRRTADRYAGAAAAPERVQRVPAVVYVVGAVQSSEPRPSAARMVQQDTAFTPPAVVVPVGGTVEFPNADPFFHNVFSYSSARRFDLGRYPQGESKSVTFDEPGVVGVFCEVHDKMRGVIIVTRNPFHAVVGDDGSFRIDGLPPGEHELAFWSADHRPVQRTVVVDPGRTTRVEVELNNR